MEARASEATRTVVWSTAPRRATEREHDGAARQPTSDTRRQDDSRVPPNDGRMLAAAT
jgi:hypothetical protein